MKSKADKMYRGSPRIESDESGKKVIKKGPTEAEKKQDAVSGGTDGIMGDHEARMQDLHMKHAKERMELFHKHEKEHLNILHKGLKSEGDDKGADKVSKVENDKKE